MREGGPATMGHYGNRIEIIHAGGAEGAGRGGGTGRVGEVGLDAGTAQQRQDPGGSLWNIGLVESKAHGISGGSRNTALHAFARTQLCSRPRESGTRGLPCGSGRLRLHGVMAHLRSPGKGANKTPLDCVASDLPQV